MRQSAKQTPIPVEAILEKAGGVTRVSEMFTITTGAVSQWRINNRIPASRAIRLSQVTGIPLSVICPEVWGDQQDNTEVPADRLVSSEA